MRFRLSAHWPTLTAAGLCLLVAFLPEKARELLLLKRKVLHGAELWRLWSGHFVHFGWNHLAWDLSSLLLLGLWLDKRAGKTLGLLSYTLAAPLLSIGVLLCAPNLNTYGGLSGLVCCLLSSLATLSWMQGRRFLALFLALALCAKLAAELWADQALLGRFTSGEIRNCPDIHLLGALLGGGLTFVFRKAKTQGA